MTLEIEMGWDCGEGLRVYLMRGLIEDCHFLLHHLSSSTLSPVHHM
jgi:hypothetical protein